LVEVGEIGELVFTSRLVGLIEPPLLDDLVWERARADLDLCPWP